MSPHQHPEKDYHGHRIHYGSLAGRALCLVKGDTILRRIQRILFGRRFIRAVYYHDTPFRHGKNLEEHLQFFRRHFSSVSYNDLKDFLIDGTWKKDKPGLIVGFDDGLRSNFDVAYPLLEAYGFVGWFFIPTDFVAPQNTESEDWASGHRIKFEQTYPDRRIAMTWDEIRELRNHHHVIGSHTRTHHRMIAETDSEQMDSEIVESKQIMESELGERVKVYCWVGGEEHTYNREAARIIRSSGYELCFTALCAPIVPSSDPYHLHRTGLGVEAPLHVVKFQLSGIIDVLFGPTRGRVRKILADAITQ